MAGEITDHAKPPPPPLMSQGSPRVLQSHASVSERRFRFRRVALAPCMNHHPSNLCYTNQQQIAPIWVAPQPPSNNQICRPSQNHNGFQASVHHGDQVVAIYETVNNPAPMFPNEININSQHWSPTEHGLFLLGLRKYGRGRWGKIAKHFVWSKTAQQIQIYAENYLRQHSSTPSELFNNPPSAVAYAAEQQLMRNVNPNMGASTSHPNPTPIVPNEPQPQAQTQPLPEPTLVLFPMEPPFPITTSFNGFNMQANGVASTSMTASGEVDLELRLGY